MGHLHGLMAFMIVVYDVTNWAPKAQIFGYGACLALLNEVYRLFLMSGYCQLLWVRGMGDTLKRIKKYLLKECSLHSPVRSICSAEYLPMG